jgi:hypothetical protein
VTVLFADVKGRRTGAWKGEGLERRIPPASGIEGYGYVDIGR